MMNAPTTGAITITTTAAAGGGSLLLVPYTKNTTSEVALPTKAGTLDGLVQWKCMAKGAAAFVGVSVASDALDPKYVPSDCK